MNLDEGHRILETMKVPIGALMQGSNVSKKRAENDFYETPNDAINALIAVEYSALKDLISSGYYMIDPGAGRGALMHAVKRNFPSCHCWGVDIAAYVPKNPRISIVDFLNWRGWQSGTADCDLNPVDRIKLFMVMNPPFKQADAFIEKCFELDAQYLACYLPMTFFNHPNSGRKRDWARKKLLEKYPPSRYYPLGFRPDFSGQGAPTMDSQWVVWDRNQPPLGSVDYVGERVRTIYKIHNKDAEPTYELAKFNPNEDWHRSL